jgi:hypothetical protein
LGEAIDAIGGLASPLRVTHLNSCLVPVSLLDRLEGFDELEELWHAELVAHGGYDRSADWVEALVPIEVDIAVNLGLVEATKKKVSGFLGLETGSRDLGVNADTNGNCEITFGISVSSEKFPLVAEKQLFDVGGNADHADFEWAWGAEDGASAGATGLLKSRVLRPWPSAALQIMSPSEKRRTMERWAWEGPMSLSEIAAVPSLTTQIRMGSPPMPASFKVEHPERRNRLMKPATITMAKSQLTNRVERYFMLRLP